MLGGAIRRSVEAHRADCLLCTTADIDILPNAASRFVSFGSFWPSESAAIIHFGYPKGGLSKSEDRKRLVYELAWKLSFWKRILLVNPLVYESFLDRGKTADQKYSILPDPVPEPSGVGSMPFRVECDDLIEPLRS